MAARLVAPASGAQCNAAAPARSRAFARRGSSQRCLAANAVDDLVSEQAAALASELPTSLDIATSAAALEQLDRATPDTGSAFAAALAGPDGFFAGALSLLSPLVDSADEARLVIGCAFLAVYLGAGPGLGLGVLDALVLVPLDALLRKDALSGEPPKLKKCIAQGNFGRVYEGLTASGVACIAKKAKDVEGGELSMEVELQFARRSRRSPALSAITAPFLGSYADGSVLVWRDAGTLTLAQAMLEPGLGLASLGEALGVPARGRDEARRGNAVVRAAMRLLLRCLSTLHYAGIVHRDIKPDNFLIADDKSLRLLDFGAAVDLRTGYGYDPDMRQFDPCYAPPEETVLPESIPSAPPIPIAALLSPLLWAYAKPHLFDCYSAGIVLLQLGIPALRRRNTVGPDSVFKRALVEADYDLRRWRAGNAGPTYDFSLLDANGGLAWDLACRLVTRRNALGAGRLSATQALLHPWFLGL